MALFGSDAPDHPMAGIRQAKKLISELPAYDSIKALDEVIFWLDSIGRTEGFAVDHRYELIDLLDPVAPRHTPRNRHFAEANETCQSIGAAVSGADGAPR
jgi:hypothetical protein